ncbi:MAG: histidine kinase [Actinomycetota bacterium]|nr:histidine kinase [Actinomycetota bacterium]
MTVSVLSVALGLVAAAFLAAGMAIWVVAGRRIVGVMIGLVGALVLVSVAATVASAEGHLVGGPLFVAGLFVFPLVMAVYPTPRARNPIDLLALLTVGTAGALGAIYQDDVAGLMGLCIGTTLFAYVWWKIERADEEERLAILWLAFGSGFPALSAGYESFVNPSTANGVPTAITFLLVPTAMAIGLIRPKIVDVRTLIVGAVVNFSAGLVVFSLFAGVVSYLQIVRDDRLPSIGTLSVVAALCAVGFQSSRVILRGVVDQLLFGDRPDPLVAASQVGESIAADPVLALRAIREALTLPYAALTSGGKHVAASGTPVTNTRSIPLRLGQDAVGEIVIGLRAGELALNKQDESVLRIVAPALAQAIHARALAEDLAESRGKAIAAIEDERRRLRRDLHDGLGPTLTGVAYAADAARNVMGKDPAAADDLLAGLRLDTASAISEIRRLVEGLRPPALDQLGLVQSIRQQAGRMHAADGRLLHVAIDAAEPLPALSAATEVAAYRIVIEALTNIARHSSASNAQVAMAMADGWLSLTIADDGSNDSGWEPGVGLSSMRERAEELGGTLRVMTRKDGSTIDARLPVRATASGR